MCRLAERTPGPSPSRLQAEANQAALENRGRTIEGRAERLHAVEDRAGIERVVSVGLGFELHARHAEPALEPQIELAVAIELLRTGWNQRHGHGRLRERPARQRSEQRAVHRPVDAK